MKSLVRKITGMFPRAMREYLRMLFSSAAEYHLHIERGKEKKFRSYTQLKRYQKKVRKIAMGFFLVALSIFVGIVIAPVISPQERKAEIYIPNGKGDIMLANISKNQATIVFKSLDIANGNKPLATTAFVEAYEDQSYMKLASKTEYDEFAVTHIIPITGLAENKTYYLRITATDGLNSSNIKTIASWGDGRDPIKVYATGEGSIACVDAPKNDLNPARITLTETRASVAKPSQQEISDRSEGEQNTAVDMSLRIENIQNESHIFAQTKVQTIVSWITNVPATTVFIYHEANSGETQELKVSDKKETKHVVVLTTLNAGSTYYFKAKAIGDDGEEVVSAEHSLLTPQGNTTIVQKIGDSFMSIVHGIKPPRN